MAKSENKSRAPLLFVGHGSPMNAIEENAFTACLKTLGQLYPHPKAILCVSAHWMTEGTWVTKMAHPKTIHDFYGFPEELFSIKYPAPGSPEIANLITELPVNPQIRPDTEMWGLDHGTWAVLRHIFPEAKIPVLQLSLDMEQPPQYHFDLGQKLQSLRDQGVFIIGSGNIVHNLRKIKWDSKAAPFEWAVQYDSWVKELLSKRDFIPLINDFSSTAEKRQSVPTNEHYYPLLYILGASDKNDKLKHEYEEIQNGSISMRTLSFA